MTRTFKLGNSGGFTLIEALICVAILAIVTSIVTASYESVKARTRYSKVRADMDGIARAAYTNFSIHDNNWADDSLPGEQPSFAATELNLWPAPPCPGWVYDWDNWTALPAGIARVTLRRQSDYSAIYSYCLQTEGADCQGPDFYGGPSLDVTTLAGSHLYCSE